MSTSTCTACGRDLAARLNRIPGITVTDEQLERRPSFPIAVLVDESTRVQVLEVEAWLANLVLDNTGASS